MNEDRDPGLDRDAGLPWWSGGRKLQQRTLTSERIVEAAIELIDRDGLDALSMRRLGDALGAGATSLYWHIPNKEALLDLVVDQLMAMVDAGTVLDPSATWRAQLAAFARSLRQLLASHPGTALLFAERLAIGPNGLKVMEGLASTLDAAGFRGRQQALAFGAVSGYVLGQAILQSRAGANGAELGSLLQRAPRTRYPHLHGQATEIASVSDEEQFDYGLQRLLDGLEAELHPPQPRRRLF